MKLLWVTRDIAAPADALWDLFIDTAMWPEWGPSVSAATVDGEGMELGATGTVTTAVGVSLPFRVTEFEGGASWSWAVAGIPATSHSVQSLGPNRCRAGFGVAWPMAPYLAVCAIALRKLEDLALR